LFSLRETSKDMPICGYKGWGVEPISTTAKKGGLPY
jgi:hypothetical protein